MMSYRTFVYITVSLILLVSISCWAKILLDLNNPVLQKQLAQHERIKIHAQTWPKTPDFNIKFIALPSASFSSDETTSDRPQYNPDDDYFGLPRIGAYEEVEAYCTACHSLQIVMQQRASKARWDYMLDWMSEKQGMARLPEEDRQLILSYLSSNFGP